MMANAGGLGWYALELVWDFRGADSCFSPVYPLRPVSAADQVTFVRGALLPPVVAHCPESLPPRLFIKHTC